MKTRTSYLLLAGLLVVSAAAVGYHFLSPLTVAAVGRQHGYIRDGNAFGLRVGMSTQRAREILAERFPELEVIGPNRDSGCLGESLQGDRFIQAYDHSWRGGTICLASVNGRIASIYWNFNSLAI